ncbi:hypothetical protein QBC39DRAFT_373008 [Podospora conica]|nr:hypothetical protein QBC39DRAFT_373008 [Schizothecium conicum]
MSVDTLAFASEAGLRAVLVALCADPAIKKQALGLLDQLEPHAAPIAANYLARNSPRKATGRAICMQCDKAFDEGENRLKRCRYHSGEIEPDNDYDWDEYFDDDEELTYEEHGDEHPMGFVWSCCFEKAGEEGCRYSRHVSDPRRSKRMATKGRGGSDDEVGSLSSWTEEEEEEQEEEWSENEEEEEEEEEEVEVEVEPRREAKEMTGSKEKEVARIEEKEVPKIKEKKMKLAGRKEVVEVPLRFKEENRRVTRSQRAMAHHS